MYVAHRKCAGNVMAMESNNAMFVKARVFLSGKENCSTLTLALYALVAV